MWRTIKKPESRMGTIKDTLVLKFVIVLKNERTRGMCARKGGGPSLKGGVPVQGREVALVKEGRWPQSGSK